MNQHCSSGALILAFGGLFLLVRACLGLDAVTIGLNSLRALDPTLTGSNVLVAQAEAGSPFWQVNPTAVGQSPELFTWISAEGSSTNFPNALGFESGHADEVGNNFFGASAGVAPGVGHVDNYEADYFYESLIVPRTPIATRVVNQSFIFGDSPPQTVADMVYDNYVARNNTLFISGVGNGAAVQSPATAYNGIGVGAYGGATSFGPTPDNGRSKPDIVAPATFTSYSTPQVAGAAAVLLQAADCDDAGPGTAVTATNAVTIKALLLNGAVKPFSWTNSVTAPLDQRHGAGVLNVYNSYLQLRGGKHGFNETSTASAGSDHPSGSATTTTADLRGWDHNVISSSMSNDGVNHYYFDLPESGTAFSLCATLVWNRRFNQTGLNNLDLFLIRRSDGAIVASSVSGVDNVEHLFQTRLAPGAYDLQVFKHGGMLGRVSNNETYALAFEFAAGKLSISRAGESVTVSWPVSSAGFILQMSDELGPAANWGPSTSPVVLSNGEYHVTEMASGKKFYRLFRLE